MSPGLGCFVAAGDAPLPIHGCRSCPKLCPPRVHSMKKLAGGKEHPRAGGKSIICAKEFWHCVASITGGCKTLQPPMPHGPWSMSHSQQVSAHDIPARILIQRHTHFGSGQQHTQTLHGCKLFMASTRRCIFLNNIIFPKGLLKQRGTAQVPAGNDLVRDGAAGMDTNSQDIPALRLPLGRK